MVKVSLVEFWHHLKALVTLEQRFISSKGQNLLAIIGLGGKLIKDHMSRTDQCKDLVAATLICVLDSQFEVDICLKKE